MRSSLLALRSFAGALAGSTTVFWLTAQPPANAANTVSAIMYARAEAFGLARLLESWSDKLAGSLAGVDETENFTGLDHRGRGGGKDRKMGARSRIVWCIPAAVRPIRCPVFSVCYREFCLPVRTA
jgi:hypothetical protein